MIVSVCPNPSVDKYLTLPSLQAGKINRSVYEKPFPGGKGVHVALAVNELGLESRLLGFWGGPTGNWIKEQCLDFGIECFGPQINNWNRTCLTIQSESKYDHTEILERGPDVSGQDIDAFIKILKKLTEGTKTLCISGSWPEGTPEDIYLMIKEICTDDHRIWIDASGNPLKDSLEPQPYGIHVNLSEAQWLLGIDKSPADCASELLDHCTVAAVTNGEDGLYLAKAGMMYHTKCSVDNIISTVGSGDCLLAGLLAAEYNKLEFEEMAALAVACGTANCLREELGMLYRKDVERLKENVISKKLS